MEVPQAPRRTLQEGVALAAVRSVEHDSWERVAGEEPLESHEVRLTESSHQHRARTFSL
jgi:hypothetical protein